ncbi:MAG: T9SS type A sorting domain-containing protein [Ignavibacteriales bacterium]|nr:T9SS type A sorting domain-containing protein [Ignavibacteriales bacterium]
MKINLLKLCLIALLLLMGASLAVAQVSVSIADTAGVNGAAYTLPVKVTGFNHVGSFSITITFDKNALTYNGYSGQPTVGIFNATSVTNANNNGSVSFSWFNISPALNIGTGTLLSALFTHKTGYSDLTFNTSPSNVTDSLGNNMPGTWTHGRIAGPPSTVSLTAPANAATAVTVSPTLSWASQVIAKTYRLQLATDAAFTSIVLDDATITTASKAVGPLSGNATYYWRVSATNAGGTSAYPTANSFTTVAAPPAAPTLVSPADAATGQATNVTLSWFASPGSDAYRLQVSTSSSFATTVYDDSTLTTTSKAMSGLLTATTYYWRVKAKNNTQGTSAYSSIRSFTTLAGTPTVPVLSSPANAATGVTTPVTLTWGASTGAVTYRLQVSADQNFGTTFYNDSTLTATSQSISGLAASTTYYWRVNAKNSSGTSAYSATFSFTTGIAAPAAPTLIAPANVATGQASSLTLTWTASATATSYRVQVSTSSAFATTFLDQSGVTGTSQALTGLVSSTTYYWRVSAANAGGTSAYSTTFSFTTVVVVPPTPTLSAPANGATNQPLTQTLSWNPSAGAAGYGLQVSTDQNFGSTIFDQSGITGTSQGLTGLANSTTYYWRVNATNSGGTSAYSTVFSFTTTSGTTGQLGLNMPDMVATVGSAINVPVGVTGFTHVGSFSLTITFDKTVLTFTGIANQPAFGIFNSTSVTNANANGSINISWFNVSPALNIGTGTLFNLLFNYVSGTSALTFANTTPSSITDSLGTNMNSTYTNGRIRDAASVSPGAPSLTSPANGATGQATNVSLSWSAVSAATSYRLVVSTDQNFGTAVYDQSGLTGTSQAMSGLLNGTTYYWKVNAANTAGASLYSSTRSFTTLVAAPSAPALSAPADAATGLAVSSTLSWTASAGAATYRLQVSTASSFATTVVDDATLTGTSRVVSGLLNNTTYYWRVSATNAGGTSAYSTARSFTTIVGAPVAPVLSSPADLATGVALSTTLTWNASAGAVTYRVQLSTVADFASTLVDDSTLTGTSKAVGPLTNNATYYWRVNAKNAGGTSAFSTAFSFKAIVALPSAPTLASPADTSINQQLTTTLSWNAGAGATTYHLQVSASATFATTVVDDTTLTTTSKSVTGLALNTTYYWRVRSKNAAGYSAYSSARSFKTIRTTAVEKLDGLVPSDFVLSQNYPNPFNPATTIQYSLPASGMVTLRVYDVLGKIVFELVNQYQAAGNYLVKVNAQNLPSGMYLYELRSGAFVQTKRMILEK